MLAATGRLFLKVSGREFLISAFCWPETRFEIEETRFDIKIEGIFGCASSRFIDLHQTSREAHRHLRFPHSRSLDLSAFAWAETQLEIEETRFDMRIRR